MFSSICSSKFDKAYQHRKLHPLKSGKYKIAEAKNWLEECNKEIYRISAFKSGTGSDNALMRCTQSDIHIYMQELPPSIAECMGDAILPAIDALKSDGISTTTINMVKKKYLPAIELLINDCDYVAEGMMDTDKYESACLGHGQSDQKYITEQALAIINGIITDAGL